jgi:hypothetical protein
MPNNKYYNEQIVEQIRIFALHTLTEIIRISTKEKEENPRVIALLETRHHYYILDIKYNWIDTYNIKMTLLELEGRKLIYENEDAYFDEIYECMKLMQQNKPFEDLQ